MGMRNLRQLNSAVRHVALCGTFTIAVFLGHLQKANAKGPDTAAPSDASTSEAVPEPGTPAEKRAAKLASDATGADFRAKRYTAGEKKLREAIQICMVQPCATAFKARLHLDLGYVYVAGMKHVEDGKDEFTAALTMDPAVTLSPDMEEQASVKQAFEDIKVEMNGPSPAVEPKDVAGSAKKQVSPNEPDEREKVDAVGDKVKHEKPARSDDDTTFPEPKTQEKRAFLNWFSLAIEQDLVFHSDTLNACSTGSRYTCFDRQNRAYRIDAFAPGGNHVGAGVALGTWRVLVGYDRVLVNRFTLGARIGSVIAGKAEMIVGERPFMYFHGEARLAAWLDRNPFSEAGIHPYLFVSGGAAEVDGRVVVQVSFDRCPECKLNAWKRSGNGFVGGGAGLKWAITANNGPILEARYLQFFGPMLPAVGVQVGYSLGL